MYESFFSRVMGSRCRVHQYYLLNLFTFYIEHRINLVNYLFKYIYLFLERSSCCILCLELMNIYFCGEELMCIVGCVQGKVIKTKSVEYMPFYLSLSMSLMSMSFFAYGALLDDFFIYVRYSFLLLIRDFAWRVA